MVTKTICMVKGIRLQKPSPKLLVTAWTGAPLMRAAPATMTTAMATNTKASGNHFSAQSVKRRARRAIALSSVRSRGFAGASMDVVS